jgi:hypothetical protein
VRGTFDGLGRFADPWLLVLTSLADGPKHGYAIMADVAAFSGVRMEPGTLYRALSRLERRGWVTPVAAAGRRRPYEITAAWPGPAGRSRRPAGRARPPRLTGPFSIHYNLVIGTDEWGDVHAREVR